MSEYAVVFENVSKFFSLHSAVGIKEFLFHLPTHLKESRKRKLLAVNSISFEIYKGESFGIIGPNGAGKSTMLGLIAGVMKPDKGKIITQGRIAPLLELGAGFHPELTGRENIILNAIILGMTKKEAENKIDAIIDFSELHDFIDQPIRTYSSGMLARLGFSVAVHIEPEILLIDEILAVGDANFQKKCINKMLEFKGRGVTIILVSHSVSQVKEVCDRIASMDKGKIVKIEKNSP